MLGYMTQGENDFRFFCGFEPDDGLLECMWYVSTYMEVSITFTWWDLVLKKL